MLTLPLHVMSPEIIVQAKRVDFNSKTFKIHIINRKTRRVIASQELFEQTGIDAFISKYEKFNASA